MVQRDFDAPIGTEAIRLSGGQFRLVIQALDGGSGNLAARPKPVEEQRAMAPQHAGDLLHRLDLRSHDLDAPFIEKRPGPVDRPVGPERLERLPQQGRADGSEIVAHQIREPHALVGGAMLMSLEQNPAGLGQPRLPAAPPQIVDLRSPHVVDRVAHMLGDVEAVEDVERMASFLRDHLQIRLPHVAADEPQDSGPVPPKPAEERQQGFDAALLADPQQALASDIDLIDERQVAVAALPLNFVDPDRLDPAQIHMGAAPRHGHRDRAEHLVPTRVEDLGDLTPTEPLRPAGEKPLVGGGPLVIPVGPGHLLDAHAAGRAVDAAHHIEEEHRDPPERHELKLARREAIVLRALTPAHRTARTIPRMGVDVDLEHQSARPTLQLHGAVDKSPLLLDPIQDSLDLHPAVRLRDVVSFVTAILSESRRGMLAPVASPGVWKLTQPWTHRTRPPLLAKRADAFRTAPTTRHLVSLLRKTKDKNSFRPQAQSPTDSAEEAYLNGRPLDECDEN